MNWRVRDSDRGKFEGGHFTLLGLCISGDKCTAIVAVTWETGFICLLDWVCTGL